MKELQQAINELQQAQQNFNYADKDFIDIAINQLNVAECKLNLLLKEKKEKKVNKC